MSSSEEKCSRCDDVVLRPLRECSEEVEFFACPECGWNYTKRPGAPLCDRWGSPISLVLYLIIFDKDPGERIDQIADIFIEQKSRDELTTIVDEIDCELRKPTQRVSEILNFVHSPSEETVREFLQGVSERFKEHLGQAQEFDGPCSVCGSPGHVQQIPGSPASGCFCENHAPSGAIKPIHILIAVGLLSGLGWLIYTLFLK